ncbi:MAG: dUTP diphosphatase [Pseudobdellovibrionaceae bacterium]
MPFDQKKLGVVKHPHFRGDLPKYQTSGASGFDVRAQLGEAKSVGLKPFERALIPTGLSFEIPEGFELQARPRSGLAAKFGISLVNTPGTIDSDYRGEVKMIMVNFGPEAFEIKDQERIAQLVFCPVYQAQFVELEMMSETSRGVGGFGSTGVN